MVETLKLKTFEERRSQKVQVLTSGHKGDNLSHTRPLCKELIYVGKPSGISVSRQKKHLSKQLQVAVVQKEQVNLACTLSGQVHDSVL